MPTLTQATLVTEVSRDLWDSSNLTFTTTVVQDLINAAVAEVSRIAPKKFVVDVTPTADTIMYDLSGAETEVEARRVEVWEGEKFIARLQPASQERVNASSSGWEVWNGVLQITNDQLSSLLANPTYKLRVWGYEPFAQLSGAQGITCSDEQHWAIREYAKLEAIKMLIASRELFSQWQTQSHNTDVGLAALANMFNIASEAWRRRSHQLVVLREAP